MSELAFHNAAEAEAYRVAYDVPKNYTETLRAGDGSTVRVSQPNFVQRGMSVVCVHPELARREPEPEVIVPTFTSLGIEAADDDPGSTETGGFVDVDAP